MRKFAFLLILIFASVADAPFKGRHIDYTVSGDIDPDATGVYQYKGKYEGYPYYQRGNDNWFIWYNADGDEWAIGDNMPLPDSYWWSRQTTIIGEYPSHGSSSGIATVAAGE